MTYSIVARDPKTGQLGVAVESHYFGVGRMIHWAEPGVGAVATQSFIEPAYGRRGLELLASGAPAPDALAGLVAEDADDAIRQVGFVDAGGNVAAHTGSACVPAAGHLLGDQFAVQANMMASDRSWPAMRDAFERTQGELAERLLAALDAAAAEGGDVRGRQSAALLVVAAEPTGKPWEDVLIDVRVDDHPDPLRELRRLVNVNRVWGHVLKWYATEGLLSGEMLATPAEVERVAAELTEAQEVLGDGNQEPMLWRGILFARAGRLDEARRDLMTAVENHPPFAEFLQRLAAAGFLPDSGVLRDIGAA